MKRAATKVEIWSVTLLALLLIVVLPCLNAFTPETSFLHVSNFTINLYGKYLCYAILAISVDLLWGYTGLLSLGQAMYFTLGGYMMGMYLMRMIGDLGQYHKPIPDFLIFLGWDKLPLFWQPFSSFVFALLMACLLPCTLALIFGFLAFRSRIRGVYFSILTQALTYGACLLFFRNSLLCSGLGFGRCTSVCCLLCRILPITEFSFHCLNRIRRFDRTHNGDNHALRPVVLLVESLHII